MTRYSILKSEYNRLFWRGIRNTIFAFIVGWIVGTYTYFDADGYGLWSPMGGFHISTLEY